MRPDLRPLTDAAMLDWLRLIRSDGVGPRTFAGLLARFGSAAAAIEALPSLAKRAGGRTVTLAAVRDVVTEFEAVRRVGLRFVAVCEPAYPPSLRAIDSAPPVVVVRGQLDILQRSAVAIVGSRNASAAGLVMTERLAKGIGNAGHLIVSGLARGIDAKAHVASLATGTVAVLAGGHDRVYPSEHLGLAARIAEAGALISEMPFTWEPRATDFPRRNRLVSGLSLGVVVVEAARRSGSLITARFANEQGREVFAVPGSPLDPRAEGTNDLLRQGATLCTSAEDVVDALRPIATEPRVITTFKEAERGSPRDAFIWDEIDFVGANQERSLDSADVSDDLKVRIGDLIGTTPISVDDLVRVAAAPARAVRTILTELELEGSIARPGANTVTRIVTG